MRFLIIGGSDAGIAAGLRAHEVEHKPQSAVIVGAGYIGLEMTDALVHRGIKVTVASRAETVLATVDASFGERVATELKRHGVKVWDRVQVDAIRKLDDGLHVTAKAHLVISLGTSTGVWHLRR